jgi:CSLREA domain-containing protein
MNARRKRAAAAAAAIGAAALAVLVGLYHGGESAAAAQYGPADFTLETTADAPDLSPGDGVCATAVGDNNACTLRAAIQEANAIAGANTIHVPAGTYTLSIAGPGERAAATGDLDITDDVTIDGAGAAATIVDGGGLDRVFNNSTAIDLTNCSGPTTTISGLTVRNGNTQPADASVGGASSTVGRSISRTSR